MLLAGAISLIIMIIRDVEFYRMLWTLLVVLFIFFILGDIARYLYNMIRPRVIPASLDLNTIAQLAEQKMMEEPNTHYLDDDDDGVAFSSDTMQQTAEEPQMFLDENFDELAQDISGSEAKSELE